MIEQHHDILETDIFSLDLSDEFKEMARVNNIHKLSEILAGSLHHVPLMKQSGYRLLYELIQFLKNHSLDAYLQE